MLAVARIYRKKIALSSESAEFGRVISILVVNLPLIKFFKYQLVCNEGNKFGVGRAF